MADATGGGTTDGSGEILSESEKNRLDAVRAMHPLVAATLAAYAQELGDTEEVLYSNGGDGLFRFLVNEIESVLTGEELTDDKVTNQVEWALRRARQDLDAALRGLRRAAAGRTGSAA